MLQIEKIITYAQRLKNFLEEENYHKNNISIFIVQIKRDDMVNLFLSKLSNGDKVKVAYATYFLLKDFNEIEIKNIINNLRYYVLKIYNDPEYEQESCDDCNGYGRESCDTCDNSGDVECYECEGEGELECTRCDGSGEESDGEGESEPCDRCDGNGTNICDSCEGSGKVECSNCDGDGDFECQTCYGTGEVESNEKSYDEVIQLVAYVKTNDTPDIELQELMDIDQFEKIENRFDYEGVIIKHFYGKTETEYSLYQKYRIEMDDYFIFEDEGKIDEYPHAW
jgi:hypothetical protein